MPDEYFSYVNFEQLIHYKDRAPQWIKLHNSILDDQDFIRLTDDMKYAVIGCMLLAVKLNNKIPKDDDYLSGRLSLKTLTASKLTATKFYVDSDELAARKHSASISQAFRKHFAPVTGAGPNKERTEKKKVIQRKKEKKEIVPVLLETAPKTQTETRGTQPEEQPFKLEATPHAKAPFVPAEKLFYGEQGNVRLTRVEFEKLGAAEKLGAQRDGLIEELDQYAGTNPKNFRQYTSHYAVLQTWHRNRNGNSRNAKDRRNAENDPGANKTRNGYPKYVPKQ